MKKILLATNFSNSSAKAIQYALNQFGYTQCEFTLLHAYDSAPVNGSPEIAFNLMGEMYKRFKEKLAMQMEEIKKLDTKHKHTFKAEFIATSVRRAIEILNRKYQYDLVVVGATGKGEDILFGSTATEVVLNTTVNTLIVPTESKTAPIKNVVLAVDYLPVYSFAQFDVLKEFLIEQNARLTLLTVMTDGAPGAENDTLIRYRYIDYFEPLPTRTEFIRAVSIEEGIMEYLTLYRADLLVMLTRHHSFFDVIFNRSVTRKFAFNPTIPMISIYNPGEVTIRKKEMLYY